MKKLSAFLMMMAVVIGLTGCLDDPDKSSGKLNSAIAISDK